MQEELDLWKGYLFIRIVIEGGGKDLGEKEKDDDLIFFQVFGFFKIVNWV